MTENGEIREGSPNKSLLENLLSSAEGSVDTNFTYGDIGRVRVTSIEWAAKLGKRLVFVQHEHIELDLWTKTPCTYRENYLIGRTSSFHDGEYPAFNPDPESEISVFYLSNAYTEMEGWRNITTNSTFLDKLSGLLPAAEI